MGFFARFRRQVPHQPIAASTINQTLETVEWLSRVRGTAPIQIKATPGGPLIGTVAYKEYLAVANGNIPARSGTSAGVGSVYLVTAQCSFSAGVMTACVLTTSTIVVPVYNPSASTMTSGYGIDAGQYCVIKQDMAGFYCVSPLECS